MCVRERVLTLCGRRNNGGQSEASDLQQLRLVRCPGVQVNPFMHSIHGFKSGLGKYRMKLPSKSQILISSFIVFDAASVTRCLSINISIQGHFAFNTNDFQKFLCPTI